MNVNEPALINNESIHNFEMTIDGHRSFIDYRINGGKVHLIHTEVPKELEGKGVAALLVQKTFEYLEERGLKIVPICPYVQHFLKRHPEWNRIVT